MRYLSVSIVEFLDDYQPGIVACVFKDAGGEVHRIEDKVPIFTLEMLNRDSKYPTPGTAACELLSISTDKDGRNLVEITFERPDGLEATSGQVTFVVLESQLNTSCGEN